MSLVKWDPWHEIESMFDRYNRAVGFPRTGRPNLVTTGDWSPRVDIIENEAEFVVRMEIPEVNREDVKVTVDNGVLSIQGERRQEKEEKGKTFHLMERQYGSFMRNFTLPDNVDPNRIKATFKGGLLTLQIQKTENVKTRAIEVKVD